MNENQANENLTQRVMKVTVHQINDINVIEITHEELTSIIGNSITKSFFSTLSGISISAFVSFIITLKTVTITDPTTKAIFVAVVIVFALSTLICGFFWIKSEIKTISARKKYSLKK